jgi:Na+/H+-dicarboxylate symporter
LIVGVLLTVVCSNALAVLVSFSFGKAFLPFLSKGTLKTLLLDQREISPFFSFPIKPLIKTEYAMLAGIFTGVALSLWKSGEFLKPYFFKLRDGATLFLKKGFIPVLPLYIFGFILKLQHDGAISMIAKNYAQIFIISFAFTLFYIFSLYFVAASLNLKRAFRYVKEMLPAFISGFSTMSSAATMPLTIAGTTRNLKNEEYADFVIPITTNSHMMGDNLNIILMSLSLMLMMGLPLPSFSEFLPFVFYYCIAKFSCAGVPGGGVLVILPVAEKHLGLPSDVTAVLATLYILQDPIMTASNVMGNGAFALLTFKGFKKFFKPN